MTERPYVILNVAMSADGKTDTVARREAAISSPLDRQRVDLKGALECLKEQGIERLLVEGGGLTRQTAIPLEQTHLEELADGGIVVYYAVRSALRESFDSGKNFKNGTHKTANGKSAQAALVLTLAHELSGSHVTANVLRVKTIDVEHERDRQPAPANRFWTTLEEIVAALLYLCSDAGQAVNGAQIPLYGSD